MVNLTFELESLLFTAFLEDTDRGWLQRYPVNEAHFDEATCLIVSYAEHPLRTLDVLHLALASSIGITILVTADTVMFNTATTVGFEVVRF